MHCAYSIYHILLIFHLVSGDQLFVSLQCVYYSFSYRFLRKCSALNFTTFHQSLIMIQFITISRKHFLIHVRVSQNLLPQIILYPVIYSTEYLNCINGLVFLNLFKNAQLYAPSTLLTHRLLYNFLLCSLESYLQGTLLAFQTSLLQKYMIENTAGSVCIGIYVLMEFS